MTVNSPKEIMLSTNPDLAKKDILVSEYGLSSNFDLSTFLV